MRSMPRSFSSVKAEALVDPDKLIVMLRLHHDCPGFVFSQDRCR